MKDRILNHAFCADKDVVFKINSEVAAVFDDENHKIQKQAKS